MSSLLLKVAKKTQKKKKIKKHGGDWHDFLKNKQHFFKKL